MRQAYISDVLEKRFDELKFKQFCAEIFKNMDVPYSSLISGSTISSDFRGYISKYSRLGAYTDPNGDVIDALAVYLSSDSSFNARTRQRNFARNYLRQMDKQGLLVAFVHPNMDDWRFSYVKLDYRAVINDGKVKDIEELTPAKRYSFLVGAHEHSHTAQKQLSDIIEQSNRPTIAQIESAFSTSSVTNEFYEDYKDMYDKLATAFSNSKDYKIGVLETARVSAEDFSKKLMGQIVFLYFLQKKGWLGVAKGSNWGSGNKKFLSSMLQECLKGGDVTKERGGKNFFNDYLEHLFYDTLNNRDRGNSSAIGDQSYSPYFKSRIPYLNGGLFEQIYNWRSTYIDIDNQLFKELIDTFDKYNFTVHESTPLETDVAVDPEILGRVFEKLQIREEQKDKGAFYTPANIVHYMSRSTIVQYLVDNSIVPKEELERLVVLKDEVFANKSQLIEIDKAIPNVAINANTLNNLLINVKIVDPAVGSGAFPMGLLAEITGLRHFINERYVKQKNDHGGLLTEYEIKKQVLENSIYGVDLDASAVEIARLRFWLSLVVEYDLEDIEPLPNLDYKLVRGDSLLKLPYYSTRMQTELDDIEVLKDSYFYINDTEKKNKAKRAIANQISRVYEGVKGYDITHDYRVAFSEVFQGDNPGFDIVIANPPYVSTKGVTAEYKKILKSKEQFGFADDLYYHFFIKGLEIAKEGAVICFITSDTFLTTVTKRNLRRTLESKKLIELIKTSNVFENAMVSPVITMVKNSEIKDYEVTVKDAFSNFEEPKVYRASVKKFREAVNNVLFLPSPYNMRIYNAFNHRVNSLMNTWWDKIKTSSDIEKNRSLIRAHINNLKPGELTLLGLITDGGQGLATANNGRFVGVLNGTKEAQKIRYVSRAQKMIEAKDSNHKSIFDFKSKHDAQAFLDSKTEKEIWQLFDESKDKYGRDIFGQGYLFRIVDNNQLASVKLMSSEEKKYGLNDPVKIFVPYDKGDKGGNRWFLETPFFINWSRESVHFLSSNSGKKGSGMPVMRNPQFYFRDGFCWNNVLQPTEKESRYIKARIKGTSVHDVASMSMVATDNRLPIYYIVVLLNSTIIYNYLKSFVNLSVNLQINDFRQFPIIIPNQQQLKLSEEIFNKAVSYMKQKYETDTSLTNEFWQIQSEVDKFTESMYFGDGNV